MKSPSEILKEARNAKEKDVLAAHEQTILVLREKGYSWREVAKFLTDRGVDTDHTKVFRFFNKTRSKNMDAEPEFKVPMSEKYIEALKAIKIGVSQRKMLKEHFNAPNRTITYTDLAKAGGWDSYHSANLHYGKLCADLGERLGMTIRPLIDKDADAEPYCGWAIGTPHKYGKEEWKLIMHHELGKALEALEKEGFFEK